MTSTEPPLAAIEPAVPGATVPGGTALSATVPGGGARLVSVALVVASMTSVQAGAALSVPLFPRFGVAGTTWLRLTVAAVVLLALARPRRMQRADVAAAAVLGVVMAVNAVAFAAAIDRVALGTVVAVEFCGPLAVAALAARGQGRRALAWPVAALAGVLLITRPWQLDGTDGARAWTGLAIAAVAGVGWAGYIVLTAHVGRRSEGLRGLAVAMTASAVALAPLGAVQAWPVLQAAATGATGAARAAGTGGALDAGAAWSALARVAVVALLVPLAPYALEMAALRRLEQGVFGVWMAMEPAIGTLAGWVLLAQRPAPAQLPGVVLVVAAGVGAARAAARRA